ncbi:MAG: MlaD family protein [Tatlockia sp.]
MEAKTNYTLVGLAVLILAGALLATGLWLSVGFDQKKYDTYLVYIREAVSGLSDQSPVKFNGVKVGFVNKIKLNPADPQQVELLLSIEEGTPITASTTATLISQGITGNTFVGLSAGSADLTPLKPKPNEPYPVIPATPSLFHQLDMVLKEVSESVNKVSKQIGEVFNRENIENVNQALKNIKTFSGVMAKNSKHINQSIQSADVLLHNASVASHHFPELMKDLKEGVASMRSMANSMTDAGKSVSTTMESGKSAIDKISQQAVPSAITVLHRMETIAANLEKVSAQMRQNPAVIIRGTTPPQPGPGE